MAVPLVSVVTPAYQSARFLTRCIDSVRTQTHPRVEHVVQDAASTDGSREILERYRDCVDWVSEPDQGQGDGLDRALKRCRGDIILVLNADDMLLTHAAAWAVDQMERYPEEAVVYGDVYLVDEADHVIGRYRGPRYDFARLLCVEVVPPAQAAFIRRNCLETVGLGTDTSLRTCSDYEMWVRLGRRFPMRHVRGFVTKYRMHAQSGGCRPDLVEQFVHDKRTVMDRVFADPTASLRIRGLRRRAYVGLGLWAERTRVDIGAGGVGCLTRSSRAFVRYPSPRNLVRVVELIAAWVYHCLRGRRIFPDAETDGPW